MPQINLDPTAREGLNGLSIWFPLAGSEWQGPGWVLHDDYFSGLAGPDWAAFLKAVTPFLSPAMRFEAGSGRLLPGNAAIWQFVDELTLRPVEPQPVALGEKGEGVYELAVPASALYGYSGAGGGGATRLEPDRGGNYRVWVKGFDWGSDWPTRIVSVKLIGPKGRLQFEQGAEFHTVAVYTER